MEKVISKILKLYEDKPFKTLALLALMAPSVIGSVLFSYMPTLVHYAETYTRTYEQMTNAVAEINVAVSEMRSQQASTTRALQELVDNTHDLSGRVRAVEMDVLQLKKHQ